MKPTRFLLLLAVFTVVLALQVLPVYAADWQPVYEGVDYASAQKTSPRLMRAFAIRVDTWNPNVSFFATPGNGSAPRETNLQTTPNFRSAYGLEAAVNANFFSVDDPTYAYVQGLLISNGTTVSYDEVNRQSQLRITANNVASIAFGGNPTGIYTAVAGDWLVLQGGANVGDPSSPINPMTGVGVSQDGRYVIWLVVDGRQTGWSLGCTYADLGQWLIDFGAWNGYAADGGGSSCICTTSGILNRPCYGYARAVGANIGVNAPGLLPLINPPYYYDSSIQGWSPGNGVSGIAYAPAPGWPGCMYFDQLGNDGFVYSSRTSFVGSSSDAMTVRLYPQSGDSASHDMKVYWRTAEEPWWDEAKSSPIVNYTAQDSWATVNLTVNNPKWVGKTITQLRLDVDAINHGTRFIVDYVTLGGAPVPDIIIDNPQGTCSANWATSTSSTQKYGADYRWRSTQAVSDAFTWTPNITTAGNYEVYAWWPASSNRSTTAPYIVYYNGGSANVPKNQQTAGGQWNSLGIYPFAAGTTGNVKLSCWTTTGFVVCADAVKFVKR